MSETPQRDAFDALLRRARADHASYEPPDHGEDRLWETIARDDAAATRRVWASRMLLGVPLAVAIANMIEPHLLPSRTLDCLTRGEITSVLGLPTAAIAVSLFLVSARAAGAQMLLRALLWSAALLGVLANITDPHLVPVTALCGTVACGGTLLILRGHGLEPERYRGSFAPVAHRGVLTLMMILAVADAQTLVSWSTGSAWHDVAPGVSGLSMIAGIVGLYRLRMWGLLCNLVLTVTIALLAATDMLMLPWEVVTLLCATATVQVLLAAIVLRSIRRGTPVEIPRWAHRGRALVWMAIVALIVGGGFAFVLAPPESSADECGLISE